MAPSLRLAELRIPLRRPFTNARRTVAERGLVLVGITEAGATGWGEAAPFPGMTAESVNEVWEALRDRAGRVLDGDLSGLPATGAAAADQARSDWKARMDGTPLGGRAEGGGRRARACAAVGLEQSPDETVRRVGEAVEAGIRQVKIKIEPGRDLDWLRAVSAGFPEISAAADANGSYEEDDPILEKLDGLSLAYLEQPLAAGDLDGSRRLSARLETPICLDESASSPAGAGEAVARRAADMVSLKPGLLGAAGARRMAERAEAAGMAVKIGGLVETSVGRAHALALAASAADAGPSSIRLTDLVPPRQLLAADVSPHPWNLTDGFLTLSDGPGLGLDVDLSEAEAAGCVVRIETFTA